MNFASIPLAAKLSAGGVAALALLGGAIAGVHLATSSTPAQASSPIVASPTPSAPASPAARAANPAARAVTRAMSTAEAQVLGISAKQLAADLKAGQTVQQLAGAKGLSQDQFRAQLVQDVTPLLDQQVQAGTLTKAQEQAALTRLGKTIPNWTARPRPTPSASPTP
jgi:hypothetical protein